MSERAAPHHDLTARLSAADLQALLEQAFPQSFEKSGGFIVESVAYKEARVRLPYNDRHLRPGGTISGPAMFGLADCALYIAVLASIGWVPLAVTTNLTINFLSKPRPVDLIADCRLLKLGKQLAVGDVLLRSDGDDMIVAQASGTYSIPPRKDA